MSIFTKPKSFDDIKDEFLAMRELTRGEGTTKGDKSHLKYLGLWLQRVGLNDIPFKKIDKYHIEQFSEHLRKSKEQGGKGLDKGSIEKYKDTLKVLYNYAIERDIVSAAPLELYKIPSRQDKDKSSELIPEDMIAPLFKLMEENDYQLFVAASIEFACYLRPRKELLTRKVKDFNLNDGLVRVSCARAKVGKTRIVTIPNYLVEILREYGMESANSEHYIIGNNHSFGEEPFSENMLGFRFNKYRDKLGLSKGINFYSLKHSGAKAYLKAGGDIMGLMRQLGHSNLNTTYIYIRKVLGMVDYFYQQNAIDPRAMTSVIPLHRKEEQIIITKSA